jgi:hypothetical protein
MTIMDIQLIREVVLLDCSAMLEPDVVPLDYGYISS